MTSREYSDDEMAFIRVLSHSGTVLAGSGMSAKDMRDRIRSAILRQGLERATFQAGPETFAQVFLRCFQQPLERRTVDRSRPMPTQQAREGENDHDEAIEENPADAEDSEV